MAAEQLVALLDPGNAPSGMWEDTAYRSKTNPRSLNRRLVVQFQAPSRADPARQCDAGTGVLPGRTRVRRREVW
jgi:hypothetical protein